MKKIFTVLLSICLIFCGGGVLIASACTCENDPIVYVYGKHEQYFVDENGDFLLDENGDKIDITDRPIDISALVSEMLPKFIKAYVTDSWDEYCNDMLAVILPLYEGIGVDGNGDLINPGISKCDQTITYANYAGTTHGADLRWDNHFIYDYRLSPTVIADQLHEYIEEIKARTGHDTVKIIARCQGTNILMSYLQKYEENAENPYSDITGIVLLIGCEGGLDYLEAMFSGNVNPSAESVYRILSNEYSITDFIEGDIGEFLALMIDALKQTYGLETAVKILKNAYEKIKDPLLAPWFRAFYGTCGSNLACIKDNFDETMNYLFPTDELKAEYAGLIEKATYVNKNVTVRTTEILKDAQDHGVKIGIIGEYGFQSTPLSPEADYCADDMTTLYNQTLGATCAKVDGKLSDEYIAAQNAKDLGKYISVDKQVDASTCAFPETTWIIKNAKHNKEATINTLAVNIMRKNMTVSNQTEYPQFMNFTGGTHDDGVLSPLQEVNPNDQQWGTVSGEDPDQVKESLFNKIISFFIKIVNKVIAFVNGILERLNA